MDSKKRERILVSESEIEIRIEWEVFSGVLDRLLLLADEITVKLPTEYRGEFQCVTDLLKSQLIVHQEKFIDVLDKAGIDYSVL